MGREGLGVPEGVIEGVSHLQGSTGGRSELVHVMVMVLFILERFFLRLGVFLVVVTFVPSFDNWRMSAYEGCCPVDSVHGVSSLMVGIVKEGGGAIAVAEVHPSVRGHL